MARGNGAASSVSSILELQARRRSILELRGPDDTVAATVEIPTRPSTAGAMITLKQDVWTAAELRRLVRMLTRAAEKLDG